jgi:flagellar FliL protein
MAIVLINVILTAVLIFVIVPTSNKTNQLVAKVASIVDLELESPETGEPELTVSDIVGYDIKDKLTINLRSTDGKDHYAVLYVSLSMNNKHEDYTDYSLKLEENESAITEIVQEEFSVYSKDEVNDKKNLIREKVLTRIQELFKSDFIINVTFAKMVLS